VSADDDFGFAPPPFNAEHTLAQMKRALRDAKLAERGPGFELRGRRVAELAVVDDGIEARLARRLAMTPEWDRRVLKNANEQRQWLDDLKKRLARWESGDD
jgi:hypothetical protein